jgi:MFS family permease
VLAVANLAQVIGEFLFGKISDLIRVRGLCVLSSSLGAALATFLLWGLARSYAQLIVFAIIYGAFASGLISLWARIGTFFGEKDAQKIYSVMSFGRGIGNIASGPISAALLSSKHGRKAVDGTAYGLGRYEAVILFVGTCMSVSAFLAAIGFIAIAIEERTERKHEERVAETGAVETFYAQT